MFLKLILSSILTATLPGAASESGTSPAVMPAREPDGSRLSGLFPRFQAQPEPPAELRAISHRHAMVDTEHYFYEAYASDPSDPKDAWIARYVMLPEGIEGYRELDQIYLFTQDLSKKPKVIKPEEVFVEAQSLKWKGKMFRLVDRRDLTTRP